MKRILIAISMLLLIQNLIAQNNIEISGLIMDTEGEDVPFATVMLLNTTDSTLLNYSISGSDGRFTIKNVKNQDYILKISHITYMPYQTPFKKASTANVDLGTITVSPIAEILMEVVVHEAQAPLLFKGDTVEYNASTFKISPGSSVEDLLRKLPGIEVGSDGSISSMGQEVNKVYVDGKTFFGDDPKMVTQNLDAQSVSKVQVYNEKSEQEKLTGVDDGSQNKVMNLELKEDFKKGHFGKISVAYGTKDRWLARGNFNKFSEVHQLSFIGYGNNINTTSIDWNDMQEFRGSSMYSNDNGDFGFQDNNDNWEFTWNSLSSSWNGNGNATTFGGGVNYNYDKEKTKFFTNYTYKQMKSTSDLYSQKQTFLDNTSYHQIDTTSGKNNDFTHSFSARVEHNIDSLNYFIVRFNGRFNGTATNANSISNFLSESFNPINLRQEIENSEGNTVTSDILAIYNHKFQKPKRSFSISAQNIYDYKLENSNRLDYNRYFQATTDEEKIDVLSDKNTNTIKTKASALYVEPLGKRFSLSGFYNFAIMKESSAKESFDQIFDNKAIDSLSLISNREIIHNRIGANFMYSHKGVFASLGGAYKSLQQKSSYSRYKNTGDLIDPLNRTYGSFIPYVSLQLNMIEGLFIDMSYKFNIEQPDFSYLQPVPTSTDPLYQVLGNPNLSNTTYHIFSFGTWYHNRVTFWSANLWAEYTIQPTLIKYNRQTAFVEGLGYKTTLTPEVVKDGRNASIYASTGIPIIKSKLRLNLNGSYNNSLSPTFINGIENKTNTNTFRYGASLNLTINDNLNLYINANRYDGITTYKSENYNNTNKSNTNTASAGTKIKILKKTYLEASYNFNNYKNSDFDEEQNIQTLNVSIRQLLGKNNKFEIRLAGYDLLNQSLSISQIANDNYIYYSESPTLSRYFMLTISYNMKGFSDKQRQRF